MTQFEQQMRTLLRGNLLDEVLAGIILVSGLVALALVRWRSKPREPIMIWFGLFALGYGVRQLAKNPLTRVTFAVPDNTWNYLVAWLDFAIVLPAMLFAEELYGPGWRSSSRWATWVITAYAAIGIALGLFSGDLYQIPEPGRFVALPLILMVYLLGRLKGYRPPSFDDGRILLAGVAVFVAFVFDEHYAPPRYHAEPLGFFVFMLSLAIVAVRRVTRDQERLFAVEQEMASARRIQASILPASEPRFAGANIAARYAPMASVAGDFYDFVVLEDKRVGVLVADVSGHGVPAALIASMVKVAFTSLYEHAGDPALVISGLNQVFCKQPTGQYITAGYLVLDLANSRATYAGAAHPPLIICRKSTGAIDRLENNGLLLGFRPNAPYANVEMSLATGDRLLLYTDGLLEAENPQGESFEAQLDSRIASHERLTAPHFADALVQDLENWSAPKSVYNPADDLTLIVVDLD